MIGARPPRNANWDEINDPACAAMIPTDDMVKEAVLREKDPSPTLGYAFAVSRGQIDFEGLIYDRRRHDGPVLDSHLHFLDSLSIFDRIVDEVIYADCSLS